MLDCGTDVEPTAAVVGPRGAFVGLVVNDDFATHQCQWMLVKVVVSVYLHVGGNIRVET